MTDDLADDFGAHQARSGISDGAPSDSDLADDVTAEEVTVEEVSATEYSTSNGGGKANSELVEAGLLEELATNLLWRIGRVSEDGPVTVRVGLASSAGLFQDLPRLRSASDAEVETAIADGSVRVEWVGARPRTER